MNTQTKNILTCVSNGYFLFIKNFLFGSVISAVILYHVAVVIALLCMFGLWEFSFHWFWFGSWDVVVRSVYFLLSVFGGLSCAIGISETANKEDRV